MRMRVCYAAGRVGIAKRCRSLIGDPWVPGVLLRSG